MSAADRQTIPGTTVFDGTQAMKGYALNRMCYAFNSADKREAFRRDEEAFMEQYGLTEQQKDAVRRRNVLAMIEAGGNIYYLAKLAGVFGLGVQDVGAQQTGMTAEAFKERLGTGGLSHQLDGERAGFINKDFDLMCMDKIVDRPEELASYSVLDLVRYAGAQGTELVQWLAMRGALTGNVTKLHSNYHIPISNTGAGLLLLENA